jgi:hypothetical protein
MSKQTRRQRREEARRYGLKFEPQYATGREPQTHIQMHGVGYERFDSKFVTVSTKTNSPEVE